jgi:hypothetical protein
VYNEEMVGRDMGRYNKTSENNKRQKTSTEANREELAEEYQQGLAERVGKIWSVNPIWSMFCPLVFCYF